MPESSVIVVIVLLIYTRHYLSGHCLLVVAQIPLRHGGKSEHMFREFSTFSFVLAIRFKACKHSQCRDERNNGPR